MPAPLQLNAGPLTMIFQPESGFLRHLRLGDHEVVRALYGAVRDRNWDTITPKILNLEASTAKDSFKIDFDAECLRGEIDFLWHGTISGDAQGTVTYRFEGEARSAFLRNRIGLLALHPIIECAGKPCTVEKADGATEQGVFPKHISPHQPFERIRAITYEPAPGQKVTVRFEGDVFEMEDQRNWTDASFKTYSTPLELPFPARIEKGTRIQQTVQVSLPAPARRILPVLLGRGAQLSISTTPILQRPPIGLAMASHGRPLTGKEADRLKRLRLGHLRADLDLSGDFSPKLGQAAEESRRIEAPLHLSLLLGPDPQAELRAFLDELKRVQPKVALWLIFKTGEVVTGENWIAPARQALREYAPNVLFAAGTRMPFAELNRNRPRPDASALPCYPISPQVHAFDDTTLVENLAAQADTVATAREFSPRPAVISPITLRPQSNPNPNRPAEMPVEAELPSAVDARQMSLFGAGWTLGSITRLAATGGVHSLTYYETTGWGGVMEREADSPLPQKFRSLAGGVFPVYHLFADMANYQRLYPTHSSHPLQVEAITVLDAQNRRRILAANFLAEPQEVKIKTGTCRAQLRYLDETNAVEAMRDPGAFAESAGAVVDSVSGKIELKLLPYALARVDILG